MRLTIIATAVAMTAAIVLAAPKGVRGEDSMAQLLDQSQLLPTLLLK